MKTKIFSIVICILLVTSIVCADFNPSDKPSFNVGANGNIEHQNFTFTGTIPVKKINGYIGAQWIHNRDFGIQTSDNIKARVEGGYHYGRFGLRGYARYGRESVMLQEALWHGGVYLHVDILKNDMIEANTGLGTWIQREDLLPEYQVTENAFLSMGPRAHLQGKFKKTSILVEFLPEHNFKDYTFRIIPIFEVPLFKVLFVDKISTVVTGVIEYRSSTRHVDIAPLQWHWTHALRWKF